MSTEPRSPANLDWMKLFDEGCVRTRLHELKQVFKAQLELDDMHKRQEEWFKKQIELGKPLPPPPPLNLAQQDIENMYGKRAEELAREVLEKERQIYVDSKAESIKKVIEEATKRLRFLVWTVNEKGKATKLKIFRERVTEPNLRGDYWTHDIQYIGERDFQRLDQINRLKQWLEELKDYVPYFSAELKKLYNEALALATLEIVEKKKAT